MTGLLRHARTRYEALAENEAHGFAARHALVHYASGAICTMIPKNACTSLRVSLARANGCIESLDDWPWIHSNNATFSAGLGDLARAPYSFVILRCPHARLASAFLDKIVGKEPDFWALYRATGDGFDPETLTFRDFVGLLGQPDLLRGNIHWRPQSDFLVYERYAGHFALERLAAAVPEIEARTGLVLADLRPRSRHGTDGSAAESGDCFADTPRHEIAAMRREGRLPAHRALYDAGLVAEVARLLAGDLALYAGQFGPQDLLFPETANREDRTRA